MNHDTNLGGPAKAFETTVWSDIMAAANPGSPKYKECLERLFSTYWKPVYAYVRAAWRKTNEDAKDLTQAFFIHLLEGDLLARADPERGNFRKLLLTSLRNFLANELRAGHAQKRGGGRMIISLDIRMDEGGATDPSDPQEAFEGQWARELLERAIEKLSRTVRPPVFASFRRFHLEDTAIRDIAQELKATEAQVGHYIQDARTVLRRIVIDEIREYVHDETEIARELDELFKGWK